MDIVEKALNILSGKTCDNCDQPGSWLYSGTERISCRVKTGSKMFETKVIGPVPENTCQYWIKK